MIAVKRKGEKEFLVVVKEGETKTEHTVTLDQDFYDRLMAKAISKEELIRRSFEFLLAREPQESILRRFDLKVTNRYFSEYEEMMRDKS